MANLECTATFCSTHVKNLLPIYNYIDQCVILFSLNSRQLYTEKNRIGFILRDTELKHHIHSHQINYFIYFDQFP